MSTWVPDLYSAKARSERSIRSTAMPALSPVASRSLDRTGVCRVSRSALSQREMVMGPSFSSPNQLDKSGPNSDIGNKMLGVPNCLYLPIGVNPSARLGVRAY